MRLSRACEVALRALPLLPPEGPDARGVGLAELVAATGLPRPFLAKVMKELVRRGLLRSQRGRAGGYVLGRPAQTITLADVVMAVERKESLERVYPAAGGAIGKTVEPLRQRFLALLTERTVADLAKR
jgi:Rrf2 family nitric oxide-sensitive transcriptional repressor